MLISWQLIGHSPVKQKAVGSLLSVQCLHACCDELEKVDRGPMIGASIPVKRRRVALAPAEITVSRLVALGRENKQKLLIYKKCEHYIKFFIEKNPVLKM